MAGLGNEGNRSRESPRHTSSKLLFDDGIIFGDAVSSTRGKKRPIVIFFPFKNHFKITTKQGKGEKKHLTDVSIVQKIQSITFGTE